MVKTTLLNYASLFPNNFEKQNVHLFYKIFNEKTVAMLKINGKTNTARFN